MTQHKKKISISELNELLVPGWNDPPPPVSTQYRNMAQSYLKAAAVLEKNINELTPYPFAPVYFCLSHALELLLKAYLVHFNPSKQYKKHDLKKFLEMAQTHGLKIPIRDCHNITNLNNHIGITHGFRYPKLGLQSLPFTFQLISAAEKIDQALECILSAQSNKSN